MSQKSDSEKLQILLNTINGAISTSKLYAKQVSDSMVKHYILSKVEVLELVLKSYEYELEEFES